MVRTRVGYAGGSKANPTYHDLGNHTETIQIDYDPSRISYEELLEVFWANHNPTSRPWSRQYMSIILYHDEEQRRLAEETKAQQEATRGKIHTEIVPAETFWMAEGYHQKYNLQYERQLHAEIRAIYPHLPDFVDSTAAARLNGYAVGYGDPAQLEREIDRLGLSAEGQERLREVVQRYHR